MRAVSRSIGIATAVWAMGGCGDVPGDLRCDDLLTAEEVALDEASFSAVYDALTIEAECDACHNALTPVYGYDFSTDSTTYDALTTKFDQVYFQLASGAMPPGRPISGDDLRVIRTWYCLGAFLDD